MFMSRKQFSQTQVIYFCKETEVLDGASEITIETLIKQLYNNRSLDINFPFQFQWIYLFHAGVFEQESLECHFR